MYGASPHFSMTSITYACSFSSFFLKMPCARRPSPMICPTVIRGLSDEYGSWKIICISLRRKRISCVLSLARSTPSSRYASYFAKASSLLYLLRSSSNFFSAFSSSTFFSAISFVLSVPSIWFSSFKPLITLATLNLSSSNCSASFVSSRL